MSSYPRVAARTTKINIAPVAEQPLDAEMTIGGGPHSGHPCGLGGNMGHVLNTDSSGHRPRYGHWQQPRARCHSGPWGSGEGQAGHQHQPISHRPLFFRTASSHSTWTTVPPPLLSHFPTVSLFTRSSYWYPLSQCHKAAGRHVDAWSRLNPEDPGCSVGVFRLPEPQGITGPVDQELFVK